MNDTTNPTTADAPKTPAAPADAPTTGEVSGAEEQTAENQSQAAQDVDEQPETEDEQQEAEAEEKRLAELDKETEDDKANKPLDVAAWGSTGHPVADEAMRTLQNVGLSTDDAKELLLEAALSRDPSKVDQKALAAKIGPRRAKAIMEGLEHYSRDMRPRDKRVSDEVYQHTNGPNAYRRLIDQASEVLSPSEMQGYVLQIAKGGAAAQRAIEGLQSRVSGKPVSLDRHAHTAQYSQPKPNAQPKDTPGITSKAYVEAMQALHAPGSRLSFEARDRRIAELREARRIGREAGLN